MWQSGLTETLPSSIFVGSLKKIGQKILKLEHQWTSNLSAPNCIKHFHWLITLFWPIRSDVTVVSIGNNCNIKHDWPESQFETVVKSNMIGKNHAVNQGIPLYNWVLPMVSYLQVAIYSGHSVNWGSYGLVLRCRGSVRFSEELWRILDSW